MAGGQGDLEVFLERLRNDPYERQYPSINQQVDGYGGRVRPLIPAVAVSDGAVLAVRILLSLLVWGCPLDTTRHCCRRG